MHDQQPVERGDLGHGLPQLIGRQRRELRYAGVEQEALEAEHARPRPARPDCPRLSGTAPPQKPTSTAHWPAAAARLACQCGDAGGGGDRVERHVEDGGHPAGRGGGGRGGEALPLGPPRLVDVDVGVDQPGQQHLVVGQLDESRRRSPARAAPGVRVSTATIAPSRTVTGAPRPCRRSHSPCRRSTGPRGSRAAILRDPRVRSPPTAPRRGRCSAPGPAPGPTAGTPPRSRPAQVSVARAVGARRRPPPARRTPPPPGPRRPGPCRPATAGPTSPRR